MVQNPGNLHESATIEDEEKGTPGWREILLLMTEIFWKGARQMYDSTVCMTFDK